MKKILAWLLLLTLVVGLFAGCKNTDDPATEPKETEQQVEETKPEKPAVGAQDAINYLKSYYTDNGAETPIDYTRFGIVRVGGVAFDVVWSVDVGEELIKITKNEDGTYTIDINEDAAEATEYTLTATITDAEGNTATHTWNYILPKALDMVAIVEAAYALKDGESMATESRLRGKVISIDSIWTEDYQNITVTIEVEGAEDKPIKCYRMKGTAETLALLKDVKVGNIITVTGTLKNYKGTIEFDTGCLMIAWEKGDAVEAPTDPGQILEEAYSLKQDQVLPYVATLTGTVTKIDSPYDPAYGNISVEIVVEGYPQYPILCYRLKGLGVDQIAVNDLITVSGIIKNYKGTIEYDSGCQMTNRVSGGGVAQGPSSDANKILSDAAKLNPGEKLPYRATLTGEIISVDNAYDASYDNITVTIKVNGVKIQCYRMVGDGISSIRETDTITVSGIIENYNGKLEFGAKCNLDAWTQGPRNVNYGPLTEGVAYKMYIDQQGIGKTIYFDGTVSGTRFGATTTGSKGADVYGEIVSGKGVLLYFMNGTTKTYLGIEEYTNDSGKQRGRAVVTTEPTYHWVYNSDVGVYVVNLPTAGKYFLGTYSTYDNISASWIGYVDGSMTSSSTQYITKFIRTENLPADEPGTDEGTSTIVTNPEVGVAYKLGIDQLAKQEIYYFNGKMSGYYGGTDTDATKGIDVYLEAADGGYKVYFTDASGVKQYLLIAVGDDGTHINFKFSNTDSSVFVFDEELDSLYTTIADGSVHYMGTNGNYVTVNTIRESNKDKDGYYLTHLYLTTGSGGPSAGAPSTPDTPVVPGATATVVASPEVETGYKLGIDKGDGKVLYFTGNTESASVTYRLETSEDATKAVDVKLEAADGGYYLYFMKDGVKTYINVFHRTDGDPGFGKGSLEFVTEKPANVMTYDEAVKTLVYDYDGNNAYYMGTYGTYVTISISNTSYITGDNAGNVDVSQFPARFYTVEISDTPVEPPVSGTTATVVDVPQVETAYKLGLDKGDGKVLYFTGNTESASVTYRLETSEDATKAVDVKLEAADGGYYLYFMKDGVKTYINVFHRTDGDPGFGKGSLEFVTEKPANVMTYDEAVKTLVYDYDGNNAYYMGTYGTYVTISISNTSYITGDNAGNVDVSQFPARFYTVEIGEPTEPDPSEPTAPSGTVATVVDVPEVETAYKLGLDKGDGKVLYFTGNTESASVTYRLETSEDATKAVDVKLEAADGGYYLYFMKDGVKTYINVFHRTDGDPGFGKGSLEFVTEKPANVMTYDEAAKTLVYDYDGNNAYYLGTYGSYVTMSVSNTSYITGDNAGNVDVSQFPARFYTVEIGEPGTTEPPVTEPGVTEPGSSSGMIDKTANLTAGTYYMSGYLTSYDSLDYSSAPYHVWKGTLYTTNGKGYLETAQYSYTGGTLNGTGAGEMKVVAVSGKANTYYIMSGDQYLNATAYANHSLELGATPCEWVASDNENGGITLTATLADGTISLGTGAATKNMIRAYKAASNLKYGVAFFALDGGSGEPGTTEPSEPGTTEPSEPDTTEPSGISKISEVLAASSGTFTVKGVVTAIDSSNYYVQDETGAICVRMTAKPTDVSLGDTIIGTGSRADYNGMPQLGSSTYEKSSGMTLSAKTTTIGALTTADICTYVKLVGVEVTEYYDNNGAYTNPNITVKDSAGNTIQIYKAVVSGPFNVGDIIDVTAAVGYYNKFQLRNTVASEITLSSGGSTGGGSTEPPVVDPSEPTGNEVKITFADLTKGTQYVAENRNLGNGITLETNGGCHITTQLRVYQDASYDGNAIFTCSKAITKLVFNAGYKVASFDVYGYDGSQWVKITNISTSSTTYNDYTLEMPAGTSYKSIKIDAVGAQMRFTYITFTFEG